MYQGRWKRQRVFWKTVACFDSSNKTPLLLEVGRRQLTGFIENPTLSNGPALAQFGFPLFHKTGILKIPGNNQLIQHSVRSTTRNSYVFMVVVLDSMVSTI